MLTTKVFTLTTACLVAFVALIIAAAATPADAFWDKYGNAPAINPKWLLELGYGEGRAHKHKLPFAEEIFTELAAHMQNTYCGAPYNQPGQTYGDNTILSTTGTGGTTQRVNVIHSKTLNAIVVANMGTNLSNLVSSIRDITPGFVPPPEVTGLPRYALVATGWYWAFKGIWDATKQNVAHAMHRYPGLPIYVTGHSQGAFGALTALAIEHTWPGKVKKVVIFGPARVGIGFYADHVTQVFGQNYAGVVNGHDWVPSAPLESWGYKQPGNMVHIYPANSTSWTWYENGEDKRWVTIPKMLITKGYFPPVYWGDHQGTYFHTRLRTEQHAGGTCPAQVGGH